MYRASSPIRYVRLILPVFLVMLLVAGVSLLAQQELTALFAPCVHAEEDMVVFHKETHRFHSPRCPWAIRCTTHCKTITRRKAIRLGGYPCTSCLGK